MYSRTCKFRPNFTRIRHCLLPLARLAHAACKSGKHGQTEIADQHIEIMRREGSHLFRFDLRDAMKGDRLESKFRDEAEEGFNTL